MVRLQWIRIMVRISVKSAAEGASWGAQWVKNPPASAGDPGSIPRSGRSPAERKGYPLQYSVLKNSMDCVVHAVTKSRA